MNNRLEDALVRLVLLVILVTMYVGLSGCGGGGGGDGTAQTVIAPPAPPEAPAEEQWPPDPWIVEYRYAGGGQIAGVADVGYTPGDWIVVPYTYTVTCRLNRETAEQEHCYG